MASTDKDEFEDLEKPDKASKKAYDKLDKAYDELNKRSQLPAANDLAEKMRKLANMIAVSAAHVMLDVRNRQLKNERIDPRELAGPSLALEKVTKASEGYTKFQAARVEMQSHVVRGAAEVVKARQKNGPDLEETRKKIYKHELGKPSKSPVLSILKFNRRKPLAELTEEEKAALYVDPDAGADELSGGLADDPEVQETVHPEFEEADEGGEGGVRLQGGNREHQMPDEE
jgi:hypothetical protein